MLPNGRYPYDVSKSCADLIATTYAHTYNLPVTVARCGNVYGGGDLNWSRIIPGTIRSVINNQRPILRSDGRYTRDFIFVLDVVEAYLLLASKTPEAGIRGEAFNFSIGSPMSVIDVTFTLQKLMGKNDVEPVILNNARCEIRDQYLDSSKARRLLNWMPHYSLSEGLIETIKWYQDFLGMHKGSTSVDGSISSGVG